MRKVSTLAAMSVLALSANSQVVINEIMQSNIDCIVDDLNQFPDSWVELYNAGSEAVDLSTLKVSDDADPSSVWALPSKMLGPKQYQIVYFCK